MKCFLIAAKTDEHSQPFDTQLVEAKFPERYELIAGHVWVVVTDEAQTSYDVAKTLGLVEGSASKPDTSGVVVPMNGYWGFAHKDMWRLLEQGSNAYDPKGAHARFAERLAEANAPEPGQKGSAT